MKTVAVLITVHNRKENTLACLEHLFGATLPEQHSLEVFLVDDGSTDGTSGAVKEQFPQVNIIRGTGNLFWNRGMHLAWKTAAQTRNFDYYFWLNDDTLIFKDALKNLVKSCEFEKNQKIICGTTVDSVDKNKITYGGRFKYKGLVSPTSHNQTCDYFNGNIVLIPKFVYNKIGNLDPTFTHSLGDFDYGLRAKKMGIESIVAHGVLGSCSLNRDLPVWLNPKISFKKRWNTFRTPLGHNPEEYFIYERRHNGIFQAVFHYITNHLRVFFPFLWLKM